ncbi:hypothetical protein CCACVL1_20739 [Corchorus capsularis]|uniref:Uncharacterized protein n=1 Tax=Corchorus capsularis TaxID=210143 RepID=A0A1R3HA56_COCAP|nr:hypothetical protein CCACVL1_20739 [Corchorus capsularis]
MAMGPGLDHSFDWAIALGC